MAWPPGQHFQNLIYKFNQQFHRTRIRRQDEDDDRAFVELEGWWKGYRIIVSEIHRKDNSAHYAYFVFDEHWQRLHGFDNSADREALSIKHGTAWITHLHEETPHQHTPNGDILLTEWLDFDGFVGWLEENL